MEGTLQAAFHSEMVHLNLQAKSSISQQQFPQYK